MTTGQATESAKPKEYFATTHWTLVLSAGGSHTTGAQESMATLCRLYWYPLYAYVRRQGYTSHDAEDLTQEFFARLLEKNWLNAADREKGRFRTFLLVALKRFLANEWDRNTARKRGGAHTHVCFDTSTAETKYELEGNGEATAERLFDRRWAMTLLETTMVRVREEFVDAGKSSEFETMKRFLTAEKSSISYPEVASTLGMSEGALRVAIHRLRKRFRDIFREEIAQTVAASADIDDEVRYLMSVLAD